MKAWHFAKKENGKPVLGFGDGREIICGETLKVDSEIELCKHGLHASINIMDALRYSQGPFICRVKLSGKIIKDDDKIVASERTCLWYINGDKLLKKFARMCALDVIHLWDAPNVVIKYLKTGDKELRADAWDAARDAARMCALTEDATDAARAATWTTAWDVAWAARDAWIAAVNASWAIARVTSDAMDAWIAERATAKEKQRNRLLRMVRREK